MLNRLFALMYKQHETTWPYLHVNGLTATAIHILQAEGVQFLLLRLSRGRWTMYNLHGSIKHKINHLRGHIF